MNATNGKIHICDIIHFLVVSVMLAWKMIPFLSYLLVGTTWSIAYHLFFLFWIVITIFHDGIWFRKFNKLLISLSIWILYLMICFVIFPDTQIGFLSLCLSFWEPIIVYYYYTTVYDNPKVGYMIALSSVFMLSIGLVYSIRTVQINALAVREASAGHMSEDSLLTGNYTFTACLTILFSVILAGFGRNSSKLIKVISVILGIAAVYFILKCGLTISMLCLFVAIGMYFICSENRNVSLKHMIKIILVIIVSLIFYKYLSNIVLAFLDILDKTSNSYYVTERLNNIRQLIIHGNISGDLQGRINLSEVAFRTFLSHPFFGIGPQNNASKYYITYLGFHAALIDDIARYGIFGMILYFNVFISFVSCAVVRIDNVYVKAFKTGIITFFIISLLNPTTTANIGFSLFFTLPVLLEYFGQKDVAVKNKKV